MGVFVVVILGVGGGGLVPVGVDVGVCDAGGGLLLGDSVGVKPGQAVDDGVLVGVLLGVLLGVGVISINT